MDGDRGDSAEFVLKKRNTDYDFSPPFTIVLWGRKMEISDRDCEGFQIFSVLFEIVEAAL